jgi:hypothetical protein
MGRIPLLLLVFLTVMTSCGVAEGPTAQEATATVAEAEVVEATPAEAATVMVATPSPADALFIPLVPPVDPTPNDHIAAQPTPLPPIIAGPQPRPGELLLRDLWPISEKAQTAPLFVVFSETVVDSATQTAVKSLWKADPRDPQQRTKIMDVPVQLLTDRVYGQVSPDGQYIAYQIDTGENTSDLYIVRPDGSDNQFVGSGVGTANYGCEAYMGWSPDSSKLFFQRYFEEGEQFGWEFFLFEIGSTQKPISFFKGPQSLKGVGWKGNGHILIFVKDNPQTPVQLKSIAIADGSLGALAPLPFNARIFCTKLTNDQALLAVSFIHEVYTVDMTSRLFEPTGIQPASNVTWGSDNRTLLDLPEASHALLRASIIAKSGSKLMPVVSMPPAIARQNLIINSVSPDGQYLAFCGSAPDPLQDRQIRNWLYDVAQNEWRLLTTGFDCAQILGWTTY